MSNVIKGPNERTALLNECKIDDIVLGRIVKVA